MPPRDTDPTAQRFVSLETRIATHSFTLDQLAKLSQQGIPGPQGVQGPQGEIGPMPKHAWRGTELAFELEPGVFGKFTDLQGPAGETRVVHIHERGGGGGGSSTQQQVVQAVSSFVPTFIAANETFVVPENTQALFATFIDCEGILDCSGLMIEVA